MTKKGTNIMTVSGIVLTLLLGFYVSLLGLDTDWINWIHGAWFSAGFLMAAVMPYVRLNRAEFQRTPFLGRKFIKSGKIEQVLQKWTKTDEQEYYKAIQEEYIRCMAQAEDVIESKSRQLTRAIRFFRAGITIILPAMGLPVLATSWRRNCQYDPGRCQNRLDHDPRPLG